MSLVFLDAGTLGIVANPRGIARAVDCRRWVQALLTAGHRVFVPDIADYEVRRKLLHNGATASVTRLDRVRSYLEQAPITTEVILRAAELWAMVRRAGLPTAAPAALDADCILAATALVSADSGEAVAVATDNVGHLSRFGVDARLWERITPGEDAAR